MLQLPLETLEGYRKRKGPKGPCGFLSEAHLNLRHFATAAHVPMQKWILIQKNFHFGSESSYVFMLHPVPP